jgi:hypothetical protein
LPRRGEAEEKKRAGETGPPSLKSCSLEHELDLETHVAAFAGVIGEDAAMPRIAATLLGHVDHATKGAAVLGFESTRLDLDFLHEPERSVCL